MLTIYKASAGSGKTFTLTLEYIKMLLGSKNEETGQYTLIVNRDKPQRHILAITFTNKATDEMKHRIILELSILAASPDKSNYIG
ncbi:MAG: UvrD-helicase domain-containing protein, partial [Muribaculaceae bacterium]|nr:UvrD-helicase domain-containing protein [Muribaculaceae bacterium]